MTFKEFIIGEFWIVLCVAMGTVAFMPVFLILWNLIFALWRWIKGEDKKMWCAMCGTLGDHRSGGCKELNGTK